MGHKEGNGQSVKEQYDADEFKESNDFICFKTENWKDQLKKSSFNEITG